MIVVAASVEFPQLPVFPVVLEIATSEVVDSAVVLAVEQRWLLVPRWPLCYLVSNSLSLEPLPRKLDENGAFVEHDTPRSVVIDRVELLVFDHNMRNPS